MIGDTYRTTIPLTKKGVKHKDQRKIWRLMLLEEKEAKGSFSVFLSCDKRQELLEKGRWWASKLELRSQGLWR